MAAPRGQAGRGYLAGRQRGNARNAGWVDAADYAAVRGMARQFSKELDKELKKGLKDAADIGTTAVQRKLDMVPVQGGTQANRNRSGKLRRTSLRATLRRNTRTQVRNKDVRIVQGARGLEGKNARGLPRRLNQDAPFQHPTYGHVPTVSQRPWRHFTSVILPQQARMTEQIEEALDRAVVRVARESRS